MIQFLFFVKIQIFQDRRDSYIDRDRLYFDLELYLVNVEIKRIQKKLVT